MKKTLLVLISLLGIGVSAYLYVNKYYEYTIVAATITFVCICFTIRYFFNNRSEQSTYKSKVRNFIKTYDSVLVRSNELPDLSEKNVVEISSIDDLIDAQIELKKPIYYKEFEDYTVFILIDNDEACVGIIKLYPNVACPYELALSRIKDKKNDSSSERSLLEDLENTTIIRLDDNREFKISPIKKKKEIILIPNSCMINVDSISLLLKDDTRTTISLDSIEEVQVEYDNKDIMKDLVIITHDTKYFLTSLNPKKMERIKDEIKKRLDK